MDSFFDSVTEMRALLGCLNGHNLSEEFASCDYTAGLTGLTG